MNTTTHSIWCSLPNNTNVNRTIPGNVTLWSQADTSEQPCWLAEGVHLLSPQVQVMAMPTNKVQLFPFMFF